MFVGAIFPLALLSVVFERGYLAQPAKVPVSLAELSGKKCLDKVPRRSRPYCPAPQAKDVHVIILDPLLCGKVVFDQTGADAFDLIGANGCADAAAADRHAAIHFPGRHRPAERDYEIGIIIIGGQLASAEIDNFMPRPAQ
jgi:hypothetical protein